MPTDETEWTPEERQALDRLPRSVDPGRLLEEKTVTALKERGLLHSQGAVGSGHTGPGRSRIRGRRAGPFHPAWWAAGLAAALAIFFAGLAFGQARSSISAQDLVVALQTAEATERPSLIQQTGSLYVDALASLSAVRDRDSETIGTGVEVGVAALHAAAYELARLHPEDPRLRQVIQALESYQADGGPETDVHWF